MIDIDVLVRTFQLLPIGAVTTPMIIGAAFGTPVWLFLSHWIGSIACQSGIQAQGRPSDCARFGLWIFIGVFFAGVTLAYLGLAVVESMNLWYSLAPLAAAVGCILFALSYRSK